MNVLIVEDEAAIASALKACLESEGHRCVWERDGEAGLSRFRQLLPELVLLDIGLPKMSGFDVCHEIRQGTFYPFIMMMSARSEDIDIVAGLSTGADDYLPKPFSPAVLLAKIRSGMRRASRQSSPQKTKIQTRHFHIDLTTRQVQVKPSTKAEPIVIALSPVEFDFMAKLASQPKRVWTRDELLESVRSDNFLGDDRAVDSTIRRLREKVSPDNRDRFIKTHRAVGYSFEDEESCA